MATFSIEIDDAHVSDVMEAFVHGYPGYEGEDGDLEAMQEFARVKVIDYITDLVRADKLNQARAAAEAQVPDVPVNIS